MTTIIHIGKRTGTDRYLNGPYRFTLTHNGLYAIGSGLVLIACIAWLILR